MPGRPRRDAQQLPTTIQRGGAHAGSRIGRGHRAFSPAHCYPHCQRPAGTSGDDSGTGVGTEPWDAARDDDEWRGWLADGHDFGQLSPTGCPERRPRWSRPTSASTTPAPTRSATLRLGVAMPHRPMTQSRPENRTTQSRQYRAALWPTENPIGTCSGAGAGATPRSVQSSRVSRSRLSGWGR